MRLLFANLRKLARRLATWLTFGIMAALLALIFIAFGATADQLPDQGPGAPDMSLLLTFPAAYDAVLSFQLGLGGLLALIYGAAIAGSEWGWGTLKTAIARGESRSRYALTAFAATAVLIVLGTLIVFAVGVGAAFVGGTLAGLPTAGISDGAALTALPEKLGRLLLAIVAEGAIGFTIATLTRSQLAGIGAGVALYFGEQFAGLFFGDVVQYLPFDAAGAVLAAGPERQFGGTPLPMLEPNAALLVMVAWLFGSLLVATLVTERAEITG